MLWPTTLLVVLSTAIDTPPSDGPGLQAREWEVTAGLIVTHPNLADSGWTSPSKGVAGNAAWLPHGTGFGLDLQLAGQSIVEDDARRGGSYQRISVAVGGLFRDVTSPIGGLDGVAVDLLSEGMLGLGLRTSPIQRVGIPGFGFLPPPESALIDPGFSFGVRLVLRKGPVRLVLELDELFWLSSAVALPAGSTCLPFPISETLLTFRTGIGS